MASLGAAGLPGASRGDGRQATADRLGITVGTARSHLSKIFDKTGVTRQAELVRLLLQK